MWELDANGDSAYGQLAPGQPALPGALVYALRVETFDLNEGRGGDTISRGTLPWGVLHEGAFPLFAAPSTLTSRAGA